MKNITSCNNIDKSVALKKFFAENNKIALGFSGGVDSAYILYAANKYGADIRAYYVKTQFQPEFELRDAEKLANEIGVPITIINHNILQYKDIALNNCSRCYYCKNKIFELIKKQALKDGYTTIIDGTNASDNADDRPGMKALNELSVKSPLRECGFTKDEIRLLSKEAGLFTWNKAAYACLATRVNTNEPITEERLFKIEKSENILFKMGFNDFRVRAAGNMAKLQFKENEINRAFKNRNEIYNKLKIYFDNIVLDLKGR